MGRKNRIYILPTGFGYVFIAGALIMILVGASYQNNLVNMLAFFMMSLVFIAMVQTHNNLKDVGLEQTVADGGYAGQEFLVTTVLTNSSDEARFNLEAKLNRKKPKVAYENVQPLSPKSFLKLRSTYTAAKRGRYTFNDVSVSTIFPLGLFRSWIRLEAKTQVWIYPEPKGDRLLPRGVAADAVPGAAAVRGGEDYHGHRRYVMGDTYTHIDWKARAKGRPLLIKEFNDGAPAPIFLDWTALEGLDTEARLSQLCKWVNDAALKRDPFGLRLPGSIIQPGIGVGHAQRCLEALASYEDGKRHVS
ncbi:MAG: DUF58 domain-containing protein [Proteobacteria bacterium]|nr:MAG: DUF58 domain-containing protein [Pseudomonadota bacterium]